MAYGWKFFWAYWLKVRIFLTLWPMVETFFNNLAWGWSQVPIWPFWYSVTNTRTCQVWKSWLQSYIRKSWYQFNTDIYPPSSHKRYFYLFSYLHTNQLGHLSIDSTFDFGVSSWFPLAWNSTAEIAARGATCRSWESKMQIWNIWSHQLKIKLPKLKVQLFNGKMPLHSLHI